jgi:hypothetical protein
MFIVIATLDVAGAMDGGDRERSLDYAELFIGGR